MRIPTGTSGMDRLLDGGLPGSRVYVVSGPPGSGKTTFGAQFAHEGVSRKERTLFVTMHETKTELIEDMSSFDFGFEAVATSKWMRFLHLMDERGRDTLSKFGAAGAGSNAIAAMIDELDVERVVIDSTMLLEYFLQDEDEAVVDFLTTLKQTDATVLLISEMTDPTSYASEHYLAHGVIFFHNFRDADGMTRAVQIIKMRGTDIDTDMHGIEFSRAGLSVYPDHVVGGR
ncbi:MAG: RAD55 family ATPase [Halanaeroarchaeum sp.]